MGTAAPRPPPATSFFDAHPDVKETSLRHMWSFLRRAAPFVAGAAGAAGCHTNADDSHPRVFCWGHGLHGQLGQGNTDSQQKPTRPVPPPSDVTSVCAGGFMSAAVTGSGRLFTWGKGQCGALGHGSKA